MAMTRRYETKAVTLFGLLALVSCSATVGALGDSDGHFAHRSLADTSVFDVTTYGAKGDGTFDNVQAFIQAWNAACKATQAATVLVPEGTFIAGQVIFQGPCSNKVTVEVRGTIKAVTDMSAYPTAEWFAFEAVDGLVVTGGGVFDGQGSSSWQFNKCGENAHCNLLPTSLKFSKISNGVVRNITSLNSMSFHSMIHNCTNFTAENLNITAPGDSPNTDGIHVSSSTQINITNSHIGTGDDCVSIGQGSRNITVLGVMCGPGHGISVGSLGKYKNEDDVSGIVVRNCTLTNTTNGARIKTWPGSDPSAASSITYADIVMNGVKNPIIIDQNYWGKKSKNSAPSNVKLSDIHFNNIKGTSTSEVALSLTCSSAFPCQGVELQDIDLSFNGDVAQSACENAKVTTGGTLNPAPGCGGATAPAPADIE